jgi:hypothetical protein
LPDRRRELAATLSEPAVLRLTGSRGDFFAAGELAATKIKHEKSEKAETGLLKRGCAQSHN